MAITKQYSEKIIQNDGSETWICEEFEKGELVNKYMVYEDPNIVKKEDKEIIYIINRAKELGLI
jgi:hypothetical protein